ncbi:glycosyltransferase family A protein [Methylobacterium sp. NEAU K]|uniref:glycosyltransferase family A protein n=1 Tax=Methylobacterium sp. NEAU K TaxID=3064946 RepID=UPI002735B181|nr:glycosyltransferase family A protein [Methylobacterium sp. NEAU K]MDP4005517.1 glycosyltransferase family A protein [Methylobacterium sp. NEAU K]
MRSSEGRVASTALSIGVIIPSRLQQIGPNEHFVERAIASALAQTALAEGDASLAFIVGIDADADIPPRLAARSDIVWARSDACSQAGALNAGIAAAGDRFDCIAFLEDDDRWDPNYLTWSLGALKRYGFVSTTQLEVDENGQIIRINDFPTPSGWMMPFDTLRRVGCFDPAMRWHLDNEWLGRLGESGIRRCHLVDAMAPANIALAEQVRPWLANVVRFGGANLEVTRHTMLAPLVTRLVHSRSGTARIAVDPVLTQQSQAEYARLTHRYGRIPW